MFVYNPFRNDTRVLKEARTLAAAGHDVRVVAALDERSAAYEQIDGFRVIRVDRDPLPTKLLRRAAAARTPARGAAPAASAPAPLVNPGAGGHVLRFARRSHIVADRLKFSRRAAAVARAEPADVYIAHDLDTLSIALRARARTGGRVLYDSHELFVERTFTVPPQSRWWKPWWTRVERRLIRRADQVVTVSGPIADELARRYTIPTPAVILNVPDLQRSPADPRDLRVKLGIAPDVPLVLYLGGVFPFRGIEASVRALAQLDTAVLVLLGPAAPGFAAEVMALAAELGVTGRVQLCDPVPSDEVVAWAAGADAGLCLIQNIGLSYYHSLPNKLFEYLGAGVPIVASNFPTMRQIVDDSGAGSTCDPGDPHAIAAAIRELLADPGHHQELRRKALAASARFTWDVEGAKLLALVEALSVS